eukprot:gene3875-biopygen4873
METISITKREMVGKASRTDVSFHHRSTFPACPGRAQIIANAAALAERYRVHSTLSTIPVHDPRRNSAMVS